MWAPISTCDHWQNNGAAVYWQCRPVLLGGGYIVQNSMAVTDPSRLADFARRCWQHRGHPIDVSHEIEPYGDQFFMAIAGVPAIWLGRPSVRPVVSGSITVHTIILPMSVSMLPSAPSVARPLFFTNLQSPLGYPMSRGSKGRP